MRYLITLLKITFTTFNFLQLVFIAGHFRYWGLDLLTSVLLILVYGFIIYIKFWVNSSTKNITKYLLRADLIMFALILFMVGIKLYFGTIDWYLALAVVTSQFIFEWVAIPITLDIEKEIN